MAQISVIVAVYKMPEYLPRCIEGILNQTFRDYELLLVNDGSKDGTLAQMRALSASDARVRYLSFSRNFGKEAAMYAGFCNAKTEKSN